MAKAPATPEFDLHAFGQTLKVLGRTGICAKPSSVVSDLLIELRFAASADAGDRLIATNHLLTLGPVREIDFAVRRALSLHPQYRHYLLSLLLSSIRQLADDRALADTLERLDHISPELLSLLKAPAEEVSGPPQFIEWNRAVWKSPDSVTLLSKVVEQPDDIAEMSTASIVTVDFDWLVWDTPPKIPAPAPTGDHDPLHDPLTTTRHPFWGALTATLDACTGDYPWQSLSLNGTTLRSRHLTLGASEPVLMALWRSEFGLYPVAPLIDEFSVPGREFSWLNVALDAMKQVGAAIHTEGTWRLTDAFRTSLMRDDQHMAAFEAIRQRSFRLAAAAEQIVKQKQQTVTA